MADIYYSDHITPVKLGDVVEKRILFRKRIGRIVYIPGISPLNKEMDYDGLESVGIQIENGPFIATLVDPQGRNIQRKIRFVKRDTAPIHEIQPDDKLFD